MSISTIELENSIKSFVKNFVEQEVKKHLSSAKQEWNKPKFVAGELPQTYEIGKEHKDFVAWCNEKNIQKDRMYANLLMYVPRQHQIELINNNYRGIMKYINPIFIHKIKVSLTDD